MFKFLPLSTIIKYIPEMINLNVSIKARSDGQFLSQYIKYGKNLPVFWANKRNGFIERTLPAYLKKPSKRRLLSLICWAYFPE